MKSSDNSQNPKLAKLAGDPLKQIHSDEEWQSDEDWQNYYKIIDEARKSRGESNSDHVVLNNILKDLFPDRVAKESDLRKAEEITNFVDSLDKIYEASQKNPDEGLKDDKEFNRSNIIESNLLAIAAKTGFSSDKTGIKSYESDCDENQKFYRKLLLSWLEKYQNHDNSLGKDYIRGLGFFLADDFFRSRRLGMDNLFNMFWLEKLLEDGMLSLVNPALQVSLSTKISEGEAEVNLGNLERSANFDIDSNTFDWREKIEEIKSAEPKEEEVVFGNLKATFNGLKLYKTDSDISAIGRLHKKRENALIEFSKYPLSEQDSAEALAIISKRKGGEETIFCGKERLKEIKRDSQSKLEDNNCEIIKKYAEHYKRLVFLREEYEKYKSQTISSESEKRRKSILFATIEEFKIHEEDLPEKREWKMYFLKEEMKLLDRDQQFNSFHTGNISKEIQDYAISASASHASSEAVNKKLDSQTHKVYIDGKEKELPRSLPGSTAILRSKDGHKVSVVFNCDATLELDVAWISLDSDFYVKVEKTSENQIKIHKDIYHREQSGNFVTLNPKTSNVMGSTKEDWINTMKQSQGSSDSKARGAYSKYEKLKIEAHILQNQDLKTFEHDFRDSTSTKRSVASSTSSTVSGIMNSALGRSDSGEVKIGEFKNFTFSVDAGNQQPLSTKNGHLVISKSPTENEFFCASFDPNSTSDDKDLSFYKITVGANDIATSQDILPGNHNYNQLKQDFDNMQFQLDGKNYRGLVDVNKPSTSIFARMCRQLSCKSPSRSTSSKI